MNKENEHTNIPRKETKVKEGDFSSIGKLYVLEGERVRVKSIHYRDESKMIKTNEPKASKIQINLEDIDEKQLKRLQYLEEMEVINEEQMNILQAIRMMRKKKEGFSSQINRKPLATCNEYYPKHSHNQKNIIFHRPIESDDEDFEEGYTPYY